MNKHDIAFYNSYFANLKDITLNHEFSFNAETSSYEGKILVTTLKDSLLFSVHIPESYPLGDVKFITSSFVGLPHQNFNGSLCLNTAFINHVHNRLDLEIDKLRNYISRYYINQAIDDNYEYSAFDSKESVSLLFDESDFNASRFNTPYGDFKYIVVNQLIDKNKIIYLTALALELGNKKYSWSKRYSTSESHIGCWVYIEKEPVYSDKNRITSWKDLSPILPPEFSDYFSEFCKRWSAHRLHPSGMQDYILLAVGYKIPGRESFELHWDLVLIPRSDFPRKLKQFRQFISRYDKPVLWDRNYNISYERYFGRGSIEPDLAAKKVLIIGTGAIGSSLAEILCRCGARSIDLADTQIVEPGNICRSVFQLEDTFVYKTARLSKKLLSISPFIEVKSIADISPALIGTRKAEELREILKSYDIIFDCSANNEIIQMLTDFNLETTVFYISISNKAKHMLCVCNLDNKNLIERRNQMLYSFGNYHEDEFREGTGCWHPTFEASFFDINQLLNYTVRKINDFYKKGGKPVTFYASANNDIIDSSFDVKYFQPDLNLYLTIESKSLKKIEELSEDFYPNETGGILVGSYLNAYQEVVISDILLPDDSLNSPFNFQPDHKSLNKKLRNLYRRFNGMIEYIGDWHSHPNGSNQYSTADYKSIKDVADSKKVNTHNPVLLIVAFGANYFDPGFYVYHEGKLFKYKKIN